MSEHGAQRVTELEAAILCTGILIGAVLMAITIGILFTLFYFAERIDKL